MSVKYTNNSYGPELTAAREVPNAFDSGSDEQGGMRVDGSVRLGELRGEPNGCVDMKATMAKPQAYKACKGPA
jgi:hypothetical protein